MAACKMLRFEPLQEAGRFVFADATPQAVLQALATLSKELEGILGKLRTRFA
jgi:hypothetical protein